MVGEVMGRSWFRDSKDKIVVGRDRCEGCDERFVYGESCFDQAIAGVYGCVMKFGNNPNIRLTGL